MTVNYPSLYVELLRLDSDEPVQPGEMGRVIVTDCFNHAMPFDFGMILVTWQFHLMRQVKSGHFLASVEERRENLIYSTDGKIISAVAISGITEVFDSIARYQLVQTSKIEFEFHYVGKIGEDDMQELSDRLHLR